MIFQTPTVGQLRSAHVITFFDPQRPDFHLVLVDTIDRTKRTPLDLLVVDIPIDSTNNDLALHWLDLIAQARQSGQAMMGV
jgi:hypothetical protein